MYVIVRSLRGCFFVINHAFVGLCEAVISHLMKGIDFLASFAFVKADGEDS